MLRKPISEKIKSIAPCAAAVAVFAAVLFEPKSALFGGRNGVVLCLDTVVPSLFALMFAVTLLGESGALAALSRLLSPFARLIGLPPDGSAALVAAALGGYPAGAKAAVGMYERGGISRQQACRLAELCVCAGPAFIFGMSGTLISTGAAAALAAAEPCAMVICAAVSRFFSKNSVDNNFDNHNYVNHNKFESPRRSFSECIVNAAAQTSSAMLTVCVFVVLFSALRELLAASGAAQRICHILTSVGVPDELANAALPVLLEVTSGSISASEAGLPTLAFALGFGGISVHMQIFGLCRRLRLSALRFELFRLAQGLTAALVTSLIMRMLPSVCCAAIPGENKMTASTPMGAVTLIVMCIMFMLCTEPDDGIILRRRSRYPCSEPSGSGRSWSERASFFQRPR